MAIDPILDLFFSLVGGGDFLTLVLSFALVGAVVRTLARQFEPRTP